MKRKRKRPKPKDEVERFVVIPDLHCPEHDGQSLCAVNNFIKDNSPWAGLIYLGDVLDMNCISSHNEKNLRAVENQRLLQDYRLADELILKPHEQLIRSANSGARIVFIQGNHEQRSRAIY
jgi:hypothetical protein